jgi:uncharacterized protein YdiU (UPF0061 family)
MKLPPSFYKVTKTKLTSNPRVVILNKILFKYLQLPFNYKLLNKLSEIFGGNISHSSIEPISQSYAGHQFGNFVILGDGRVHTIGECLNKNNNRFDIQLKGSGRTDYSRQADGQAAIGPVLREYIISEAMNSLKIPTTRSLSVTITGETIERYNKVEGAILTRVTSSNIRIGSFEYLISTGNISGLKKLADYSINRHYSSIKRSGNAYLHLLQKVASANTQLIVNWMRVGFIHGVMNTDNMTISGESIDYGPCAFMDHYDPEETLSYIDINKRYSFKNQPNILKWNLMRLAECLLPIMDGDRTSNLNKIENIFKNFDENFQSLWMKMMLKKLGIVNTINNSDQNLVNELLEIMELYKIDYTIFFSKITYDSNLSNLCDKRKRLSNWLDKWRKRLSTNEYELSKALRIMKEHNPVFIPRNHHVEKALIFAERYGDYTKFNELNKLLSDPYNKNSKYNIYTKPPLKKERVHNTFCGT